MAALQALLPFFKSHRLSQITIAEVDRYRAAKVAEVKKVERVKVVDGERVKVVEKVKLSPATINKTITRLGQVLEVAVEYGLIERNPARGNDEVKSEQACGRVARLGGADRGAARRCRRAGPRGQFNRQTPRRAIIATLALAGLRIGELIELRWRDVDLAAGRLTVRASKTDAGVRTVDLLPALRVELEAHRATLTAGEARVVDIDQARERRRQRGTARLSDERVFPTQGGGPMQPEQRPQPCTGASRRAGERRAGAGRRNTAAGEPDTAQAAAHVRVATRGARDRRRRGDGPARPHGRQLHFRVYRHGMRRDERSRAQLAQLVGANEKAAKRQQRGLTSESAALGGSGATAKVAD